VEASGRKCFIEVKGVTLKQQKKALFPDAPSLRAVKHVEELIRAAESGYEGYIIFVIQMKGVTEFRPNDITHKAFGDALREAKSKGVKILAYDSVVTPDSIEIDREICVNLDTCEDIYE
jgi:sugar fermentation stimulation protein A